jgi:hypothetical protein
MDPATTSAVQLDPKEMRDLAISLGQNAPPMGPLSAPPAPAPTIAAPPVPQRDSSLDNQSLAISTSDPQLPIRGHSADPRGTIAGDTAERSRMLSTGPGEDQIYSKVTGSHFGQQHPVISKILGGLGEGIAKAGDIGLSAVAPALAINLPGTAYHHQMLINQLNHQIGAETGEGEKEAQTAEAQQRTEMAPETAQRQQQQLQEGLAEHGLKLDNSGRVVAAPPEEQVPAFKTEQAFKQAQISGLENPFGKLPGNEPVGNVDALNKGMQDRYQVLHPGQPLPAEFKLPANATKNDFDRLDKLMVAEETATGSQQQREQSDQMREAMLAMARERLDESESKGAKPTADEERRADLSENLNENLSTLEEIVQRRPELFGPLAGRWAELKQKFGSDDADLGTLQTIEHQIGMAQISAHGMRSALGIQGAADSILNHLHSGPHAMLAAINAARNSVKTFQGDVDRATGKTQPTQQGAAPAQGAPKELTYNPTTGRLE